MTGMNTGAEGLRRMHDTACFERHELSNGIPVWVQKSTILTSDIGILIAMFPKVGSRQDSFDHQGLAHFFEHLPFRGTTKYQSKSELNTPIEKKGGELNANTSHLATRFHVELPHNELSLGANILREMTGRPLLRDSDVELEKGAILSEYDVRMSEGNFAARVRVQKNVFGDHPLAHEVLGSPESIRLIKPSEIREFHGRFYHAANMELVCGGSFAKLRGFLAILEENFSSIDSGEPAELNPNAKLPFGKHGKIKLIDAKFGQDMLVMAYPMAPSNETDTEALAQLQDSLSNGFSSPLFYELREKRGLTYGASCYSQYAPDIHTFYFVCPTARKNFRDVYNIFLETLLTLKEERVLESQQSEQYSRMGAFMNPIKATQYASAQIIERGSINTSHHKKEDMRDKLTLADIFQWRDRLLRTSPLVLEMQTSE